MKIKQIVTEAPQLPAGALNQAIQYVSGPMLPKVNGEYRLADVMKRVKELKDAVARAKQSGRLNVNSPEYKSIIAELQKWDQWLQDSQDINKWHPERLKKDGVDPRATTDRIRAIQAELKQPVDSARRTELQAELEKLVADMETWQRSMPTKESKQDSLKEASARDNELIQIFKNALNTGDIKVWQNLTAEDKLNAFKAIYGPYDYVKLFGRISDYSAKYPTEDDMDRVLYNMIKKRQDDVYQIQIGPEKRAELARMADALAEMRRQQARKEKLEDEQIAYQRYQDEQQRQDAFKKIEMAYQHELKVINTNHANDMESIRTGNKHEIEKITMAYQEAERERQHSLTTLSQQQQHELTMQQQQQAQRESVERIAELAGVKIDEGMNPQLGKILELANRFAVAIANMKIYTDDIFANHLRFAGLRNLVDGLKKIYTDENYASGKRELAQLKQQLGQLGVKIDYNESLPTEFTLTIPGQSEPYKFDLIKLLKDAADAFTTKAVK